MDSDVTAERRTAGRDAVAAIAAASARLARAGIESARLDAELLMSGAAGVSRAALIARGAEVHAAAAERFERVVARRGAGEPLADIGRHREVFLLVLGLLPGVV